MTTGTAPGRGLGSSIGMGIPAYVNPEGGSAQAAREALEQADGFDLHLASPSELPELLAGEVAAGTPRVVVAGGDGTIASAASVLAGTATALAVLPGGTLNHFARDHGIPTDPAEALAVARDGTVAPVDVGYVNDELFLNTSSVGAYTRYVRTRERLEPKLGYWAASVVAGLRVLLTLHPIPVALGVNGSTRVSNAALVFVGVGERKLGIPGLGQPVDDGRRGLHVVLPRGRRQARRLARVYARLDRGGVVEPKALGVDTAVVDRLRLTLHSRSAEVALDGEIRRVGTPLDFRFAPDALRVVIPASPK
ncbi:MAG TPA: diacylglycerol kinase family protein [Gemmatimonadales bacterium]|nr:diacylglycerol kinase family protein [Gemmatimonadales bacterium]